MVRLRAYGLVLAIASAPVVAQVSTIQNRNSGHWQPPTKGQSQSLDQIVCEVFETTGTRLGARKVCKTALEWQQLRNETQQNVQKVQQQATSTGIPSG